MPVRRLGTGVTAVLAVLATVSCTSGSGRPISAAPTTPSEGTSPSSSAPVSTTSAAPSASAARPVVQSSPTARPTSAPKPSPAAPVPAPAGTATIAGCPLFPADNPWRRNISRDAVDPHSAAWVSSIGASQHLRADVSLPYVVVPASQPRVHVTFTAYGSESDPGPYPLAPTTPIETGSDHHVLVASADCHLYELFGAAHTSTGWSAASGAIFDLRSDRLRPAGWTSADAAGLPMLAGLLRRDEVASGVINHALRFTVARTQRGYLSPARHQAGATTDPNVPPMGARFRLKASYDISHFHGAARVVLTCLQRYGMFVADNGANWFVSGGADSGWNYADLDQLKSVPGSAFEAVATGPVAH